MTSQDVRSAHDRFRTILTEAKIPNLEGQVSVDDRDRKGWGAFGDVYMGKYARISVCVKILKEVPLIRNHEWEKFLLRLKREVTVWRGIRHPNAVELLGWTSQMAGDKIRVSLISTWCDGGDIKDYLRSNPTADRRSLIADVCRGMAYLHSRGIVHGDIKPTNIVVMKDTNLAKLCDFGLSSLLGDLSTYTQSTSTFGTIRFLSPELLTGVLEARNEGSDVWAFGCASGEILCDERPYHWITNDWLVPSAITKDPPYIWPDPDSFMECIASCFQVDPERRLSSSELLEVLPIPSVSVVSIQLPDSAISSLKMLSNVLQLDRLPLAWRYQPKKSTPALVTEFNKIISPVVQSLCCKWCDIVRRFPCGDPEILATLTQMIPALLHWVAAMGVMDELDCTLRGLYDLHDWAEDHSLKAHLNDIYRLTLQSRKAIIVCPLSLLGGCHPFVPDESVLRSISHGRFINSPRGRIDSLEPSTNNSWTALSIISDACHPRFSPKGCRLAHISNWKPNSVCVVRDLVTRKTSELKCRGVEHIAFSPDGSYLALSTSKNVCIWKCEADGTDYVELEEDRLQKAGRVAFSPDGRYLTCCSVDGSIYIWNVADWTTSRNFKSGIDTSEPYSITFSSDSRHIALSTLRHGYIWDTATQPITCVLTEKTTGPHGKAVVFSPDGYFIASVNDSSVHLWKASTWTEDFTFEHSYMVKAVTFSPRGHQLVSCLDNGTITIWDLMTRVASSVFEGKGSWAGSFQLEFSPDGRHLALCAKGRVRVWNVGNGTISVERLWKGHETIDPSMEFSSDGRYLATAFGRMPDNIVLVLDLSIGTYPPMLAGHQKGVVCIIFSPNGRQLVSVSRDSVYVWNTETWARDKIHGNYGSTRAEFSNDGRLILIHSFIGIKHWVDASTLEKVKRPGSWDPADVTTFPAPRFPVFLSDDKRSLFLTRGNQTIHFWFPDSFEARSEVSQYNDVVCIGGRRGEVLSIDLAGFEVPDI